MKKTLMLLGLMLTGLLVYLHADTKKDSRMGYQTATIISVDKHVTPSNYVGGSPSDAPLQAEGYSYDIGIRLNCNLYVGRYESAIDYLPTDFALHHSIDVRLDRHVMYVSLPQGDRDVKMGIVSHHQVKTESCRADS